MPRATLEQLRELSVSAQMLLTELTDAGEHSLAEQAQDLAADLRDRIRHLEREAANHA